MNVKLFFFTPEILVDLFKTGTLDGIRCVTPLPADAKLDRVFIDYAVMRPRVGLVVSSASFPVIADGSLIPEDRLLFEKLHPSS